MDISSKGPTRPDEDNIHQEKVMHVLYTNADCLRNKFLSTHYSKNMWLLKLKEQMVFI